MSNPDIDFQQVSIRLANTVAELYLENSALQTVVEKQARDIEQLTTQLDKLREPATAAEAAAVKPAKP